eukprot:4368422-Pyramimonas_sp.AAC.1
MGSVQNPESLESEKIARNLPWRCARGSPEALPKRCQDRFHAYLHACRHAWTRARSTPGPAATSNELLRGLGAGGKPSTFLTAGGL